MKTIFSNVKSDYPLANDLPSSFTIQIDNSIKQRIKELSEAKQELNFVSIEDFCHDGVWSTAILEDEVIAAELENTNQLGQQIKDKPFKVDFPLVVVTGENFYFTAIPKNGDEHLKFYTQPVSIAALDDEALIILND